MSFIDSSYFILEINVPNAGTQNPALMGATNELQQFIEKYESKYLSEVLGYEMYKDFLANIQLQKYKDLLDGVEFTDSLGRLNKWCGFVNSEKVSPIANYVYVKLLSHRVSSLSGVGLVGTNTENSVRVDPSFLMTMVHNEMVEMNIVLHNYLLTRQTDYRYYTGLQFPPISLVGNDIYSSMPNNLKIGNKDFFTFRNRFGI